MTDVERVAREKDEAYHERNKVVAVLARLFPSGVMRTEIEGWNPEWHGCVYIDLPSGQVSWHFHNSQVYLFEGLPAYQGEWDGHTTEEKYERLLKLLSGEMVALDKEAPVDHAGRDAAGNLHAHIGGHCFTRMVHVDYAGNPPVTPEGPSEPTGATHSEKPLRGSEIMRDGWD